MRLALALALAALLLPPPARAGEAPTLRGDVTVRADTVTLADLVENAGAEAGRPLFRAPALGETGTIQTRRIVEAAAAQGLTVETGGRAQVTVTRAARRVGAAEIEAAVKRALEAQGAAPEPGRLALVFDGAPPQLVVAPDLDAPAQAEDVVLDRRSRRVAALIWVGPRPGERRAQARITGTVVEMAETAVLTRALKAGEAVQAGDVAVERRPREGAPSDLEAPAALVGRVARRALPAGSVLRAGDLARPEIVARGEAVTVVYEVPGMVLTLRGRATESGALGDTVAVVNVQSKKALSGTVTGPGRVSVSAPTATPGRLAAAEPVSAPAAGRP